MKIEMTTSMAGAGFVHNVGDIVNFPEKEAIRIMEAGFAIPIRKAKKKEKAVKNG